jgi:hypothetical protein
MNMKVRKILTLIFDFANYSFIIPAVSRIMVVLITTQFDAVQKIYFPSISLIQ